MIFVAKDDSPMILHPGKSPKIRVKCVARGWIETAMVRPVFEDESYKRQVLESIPLKRVGTTDDVALSIFSAFRLVPPQYGRNSEHQWWFGVVRVSCHQISKGTKMPASSIEITRAKGLEA